jgi:hypothetical protein
MILYYIFDLIIYWASYNFFHIIKINYINPLIGLDNKDYFRNSNNQGNKYLRPIDYENCYNLFFYLIIIIICLIMLKYLNNK